jgi:outer membrane cobalamin receptor
MKKMLIGVVLIGAAMVSAVPLVVAEDSSIQLKEVVVTATKTEKEPQDVTQTVTVISAADIQKSAATTVAEVIDRTVGTQVKSNGPLGSTSSINIRGANSEQVLVLLDGRRLNSASAGGFDMADLPIPLENIERIEIVSGPSSALYGADAVGGVVNIITKKPTALTTTITGEAGSHGYESLRFSNSNKLNNFYYSLSAGTEKYDGFRLNSDLDQWTAGAKLGYDLSPDSSLEFTADYLDKEIGVPGLVDFPSPFARQWDRNLGSSLTYKTRFSKELDLKLKIYENRDKIIYLDPIAAINSEHISTSNGAEAQTNWLANSWNMLTIGIDGRQDHIKSTDVHEHTASLWALYLQDEMSIGDSLIIVIGGRNDNHSVYGDKFSPKVSSRYLFSSTGTIARASAGEAFRAPTLNELYWPFVSSTFFGTTFIEEGNPNLKPEEAIEYEMSVEQPMGKGNLVKAAVFERNVDNMISWLQTTPTPTTFHYSPVNIGKARITGYEIEAKITPLDQLTWVVNYTYMNPKDESTGAYVPNIPAEQFKSYVNMTFSTETNIYIEGRYVRNYIQPTLPNPSRHYTVVDAKIMQPVKVGRNLKCDAYVGVKNLFNRQYEILAGYPMPPEELYGGVSLQF